ncbi:MAG: 2,5-diamino-6-(ribosylamino)-4(3H)-pyrimidinone 5'-phosphate reductase [Thermoplasmatota archaeon]
MKPKVIINLAMSADGKIALSNRREVKISSEEDFRRVHQLRNRVDAILVGIGTVFADDPKLTVKEKYVKGPTQPLKVVLDSKGRIPEDAKLFEKGDYLIATSSKTEKMKWMQFGNGDKVNLNLLLNELERRGVNELLVEGGGEVIYSFLKEALVDEIYIFVGSIIIGGKDAPTPADGEGAKNIEEIIKLDLLDVKELDDGVLLKYKVRKDD